MGYLILFSSYMTYNMHRGAGVMPNGVNNTEGKANFFLGQVTQVLTSLAMGVIS